MHNRHLLKLETFLWQNVSPCEVIRKIGNGRGMGANLLPKPAKIGLMLTFAWRLTPTTITWISTDTKNSCIGCGHENCQAQQREGTEFYGHLHLLMSWNSLHSCEPIEERLKNGSFKLSNPKSVIRVTWKHWWFFAAPSLLFSTGTQRFECEALNFRNSVNGMSSFHILPSFLTLQQLWLQSFGLLFILINNESSLPRRYQVMHRWYCG